MKEQSMTSKEAVSVHLKTSILTLRLVPGADLDEARLSESFSLSRTPLREILRDLAGEGYVELYTGRGARVAELSHANLRDFFLAAPMIYGAIMRLAAHNATGAQIDSLQTAQDQFRTTLQSGTAADRTLANNAFHQITGDMAGNTYLLPSFRRLLIDHARIGMTFYQPTTNAMSDDLTKASAQHDQIIAAIKAREADAAAKLADAHWQLSRDQIESYVMPNPLDAALGALPKSIA